MEVKQQNLRRTGEFLILQQIPLNSNYSFARGCVCMTIFLLLFSLTDKLINATGGETGASFRSAELQALFDQFGHKLTANGNILLNIPNAGARVIINADNVDNFARALANRYAAEAGSWHYNGGLAIHRKKSFLIFPSLAGMSLTRLSLGGNYDVIYKLFCPGRVW